MADGDEEDGLEVISDDDEQDEAADGNGGENGGTVPVIPQVCCPSRTRCWSSRLRFVENQFVTVHQGRAVAYPQSLGIGTPVLSGCGGIIWYQYLTKSG